MSAAFLPVILAGGAGTRLWPLSRAASPKPFMRLPDGQTLLQKAYRRAAALPETAEVLTIARREYYFQLRDEYSAAGSQARACYLLEPQGRNTAAAVAFAALYAQDAYGAEAELLILPADHLIEDEEACAAAVAQARELARQDWLVVFGITPTAAETGYGYIKAGEPIAGKVSSARAALRFAEKPDAATASRYLAEGDYFWNAGMFCFTAGAVLAAMERHCSDILAKAQACWTATDRSREPIELAKDPFDELPDISIDYALMEKADRIAMVPCSFGWSDIGAWPALAKLIAPDGSGNRLWGEVLALECQDSFIHSEHHLVAALGVQDLIIVDTPDATLVAHKDKAQEVKKVVATLNARGHESARLHRTVIRPWGSYTVLEEGQRFKIKRIVVKPGASLSLQMHHHRSEHWVVIAGMARVVNGEREIFVRTDESTYIPAGTAHRLANPGKIDCVMIEVQTGDYVGEDDIVRLEDNYGRC